jgi:hypothetical protein
MMDDPFAYAIANRLQSGWTTRVFLRRFPQRANGLFPWIVPGGRLIDVRECEPHPYAEGVVRYEEVNHGLPARDK